MENKEFQEAQKKSLELKEYAKSIIREGEDLQDIAVKLEKKMQELKCKPAFPINLCKNEIAAHFTPNEKGEKAEGLLKIDIGIIYKENIIDFAFSLDLTKEKKYGKLIEASQKALEEASKLMKKNTKLNEIGKKIQETISKYNFSPIRNLSGHEISRHEIHAGLTIPNYDNHNETKLPEGSFAVEPFATSGEGVVIDGKKSGIYRLESRKAIRDSLAREILNFVEGEHSTLPFCERWIIDKFGHRAKLSLSLMEQAGILHNYPILIEKSRQPVSQAENTFLIE